MRSTTANIGEEQERARGDGIASTTRGDLESSSGELMCAGHGHTQTHMRCAFFGAIFEDPGDVGMRRMQLVKWERERGAGGEGRLHRGIFYEVTVTATRGCTCTQCRGPDQKAFVRLPLRMKTICDSIGHRCVSGNNFKGVCYLWALVWVEYGISHPYSRIIGESRSVNARGKALEWFNVSTFPSLYALLTLGLSLCSFSY